MSIATYLALCAAVSFVFGATLVIVSIRSRRGREAGPRCGNCEYNLTGATGNRCPECGQLFVEAGVIKGSRAGIRITRRGIAIVAALLASVLLLFIAVSVSQNMAIQAERQRAMAARQASLYQAAQYATDNPADDDELASTRATTLPARSSAAQPRADD